MSPWCKHLLFLLWVFFSVIAFAEFSSRAFYYYILGDPEIFLFGFLSSDPALTPIGSVKPTVDIGNEYKKYRPGPMKIYVPQKNSTDQFEPYFAHINSMGFRGPEKNIGDKNEIRVVCIGESSTFGAFLRDEETWPEVLEKEVQTIDPKVRIKIWNLGVSESTSTWNLAIMDA